MENIDEILLGSEKSRKNEYYCVRSDEEYHFCSKCENCYCKENFSEEYYEPSADELEAEFERRMIELEWR